MRIQRTKKQKQKMLAELKAEMSMPIKVTFKDEGQDFLEWYIMQDGTIVDCKPCQASIWCKYKVVNVPNIAEGAYLKIQKGKDKAMTLLYPVEKWERVSKKRTY